jgi:outer membrane lipoprotein LolB
MRWLVLSTLLLLCACAHQPRRVVSSSEAMAALDANEQRIQSQSSFHLRGKIAIRSGADGGNGRFDWQQNATRLDFTLSAPLSNQTWKLSGQAGAFELVDSRKGVQRDGDAYALVERVSGWRIPIAQLQFWVRGARSPQFLAQTPGQTQGAPSTVSFTRDGKLGSISQDGWLIEYQEFDRNGRPSKLKASSGDAWVKVKITDNG